MIFKLSASRVIHWVPTLLPGCNPLTTHHRILTFWGSWVHIYKTFTRDYSRGKGTTQVIHHIDHSPSHFIRSSGSSKPTFCARPSFLLPNLRQRSISGLWNSYESNQPTRLLIQLLGGLIILLPTYTLQFILQHFNLPFLKKHINKYVLSFFVSLLFSIREPNKWTKQKWVAYGNLPRRKLLPPPKIGPSFSSLMLNFPNNERLNTCNDNTTTDRSRYASWGPWWKRCPLV